MGETTQTNKAKYWWYVLLIVPFIGTLFPAWYSFDEPRLWGIPFFYWYQFLWVIISAVLTVLVYKATKEE